MLLLGLQTQTNFNIKTNIFVAYITIPKKKKTTTIGIERKRSKNFAQRSSRLLNGFKEVQIIIFVWYANHSYMINLTLIKNWVSFEDKYTKNSAKDFCMLNLKLFYLWMIRKGMQES